MTLRVSSSSQYIWASVVSICRGSVGAGRGGKLGDFLLAFDSLGVIKQIVECPDENQDGKKGNTSEQSFEIIPLLLRLLTKIGLCSWKGIAIVRKERFGNNVCREVKCR